MLEHIKLFGGIAGLISAVFLVWDRWARGRPLAGVTAKQVGRDAFTHIRINNPGPADVFIVGVRAEPPIYRIAREQSDEAIEEALNDDNADINLLLRQGEVRDLPIYFKLPKGAPSQRVRFLIYWRKTSSTWLPQFPIPIWTSTGYAERISAAVAAQRARIP
jgi:hypothetical protein